MKLNKTGSFFKKKKGSTVLDILFGSVVFVVFAIITIIAFTAFNGINDAVQLDDSFTNESKANLNQTKDQFPNYMDNAFLLLVILFWVSILVTSFFLDTYPVFFIISIVLLVFVFIIGMNISNTYEDVMSDSDLSSFANDFPKINWIMSNLLLVLIVMGVSSALALYANSGGNI